MKTVIIHDWEDGEGSRELISTLKGMGTTETRIVVVGTKGEISAASSFLEENGVMGVVVREKDGPAARKNRGLSSARGDVLLLTCRAKFEEGGLPGALEEAITDGEDIGIVGCKLVDGRGRLLGAGDHLVRPGCDVLHLGEGQRDIGQYHFPRVVDAVDSRCMMISRMVLERVSRFNEDVESGLEDLDFCLTARSEGWRTCCTGVTSVTIEGSDSYSAGGSETAAPRESTRESFCRKWEPLFRDSYETRVMWHSWINAPSGYAVSSQHLVRAMEAQNVDVRYGYVYGVEEPPNEDERIMEVRRKPKDLTVPQVVYGQGDVFYKNSGTYKIGYSMLEVDGIPEEWVRQANAMDEVWVPSHFNRETFSSCGVEVPIEVMPLGVDTDHFHPHIRRRRLNERYTFLSVFEWGERKAPEVLIKAYNRAFSADDDVALILKVTNADPHMSIERQVEDMRLLSSRAPIVMVVNQKIADYQLGMLYRACDCFVLPTRGEGWGMPTLEAMACGLPAISTCWSGQTEFFNEEVGYPIEVKSLVPASGKLPYYEGFSWADPDPDHLVELMRYVFENREEASARGARASGVVREKWTWMKAAGRIKERLLAIGKS